MKIKPAPDIESIIDATYREHRRRVLATLVRLLGGFDRAEEALHDAFLAATDQWSRDGVPSNPVAWLVSAGRFKAIDTMRRRARFNASLSDVALQWEADMTTVVAQDTDIGDDQLRLIFICCDPKLPPDAQVAMTLREVCGLTTEEIAHAFLTAPPTLAQRIVRAKAKIRDEKIPYVVPDRAEFGGRLATVLRTIYLVFSEGYAASSGASLIRTDLSAEAIRLGRLLAALLPDAEVIGLLALMLLHESRRRARASAEGDIILLTDQDRALWDTRLLNEGAGLARQALAARNSGTFTLQAGIALAHAEARSADATDWTAIVAHYDALFRIDTSPVVALNRAVAVAMRDGPEAGLALIDGILSRGELTTYRFAHAARADLLRRIGRRDDARAAYEMALTLTEQAAEYRFLKKRISELAG